MILNLLTLVPLLIPLIGGVLSLLVGFRIIPNKPKNPERYTIWIKKYGKIHIVLGIFLIISSTLKIIISLISIIRK